MSDSKHTPGPWFTKRAQLPVDGEYDWCVGAHINGKPHVIIEAFGRVSEDDRPNAEANARLIAAAPEMFEALEQSMQAWVNAIELDLLPSQHIKTAEMLIERARAALSKARGE